MKEIANILSTMDKNDDILRFLNEIFTESEIKTLSKRWRILRMLTEGRTQREIADELSVSLCKVTRGSRILKDQDAIVSKYLIKEKNND